MRSRPRRQRARKAAGDRRHGTPRRGRGAAWRLSAQPKIIRTNPPVSGRPRVLALNDAASERAPRAACHHRRRIPPMPHEFRRRVVLAGVVAACIGASAATTEPAAHHRGNRFQNNYLEFEPKGLGALIEWRAAAARKGLPHPPETATPRVAADLDFIRGNAGAGTAMIPAVTWIGHASTLVQAGGVSILTDPIFSERASPGVLPRSEAPGRARNRPGRKLPHIDAVLNSHNHYDHLDADSGPRPRGAGRRSAAVHRSARHQALAHRRGHQLRRSSWIGGRARASARPRSS